MNVFEETLREKVKADVERSLKESGARLTIHQVGSLVDDRIRRIAELIYESHETIAGLQVSIPKQRKSNKATTKKSV